MKSPFFGNSAEAAAKCPLYGLRLTVLYARERDGRSERKGRRRDVLKGKFYFTGKSGFGAIKKVFRKGKRKSLLFSFFFGILNREILYDI